MHNIEDPQKLAEYFIERFHQKTIGGGEMLKYLTLIIEKHGRSMRKQGYEEGRERQEKVYAKGIQEGYRRCADTQYLEGYNKGYKDKRNGL